MTDGSPNFLNLIFLKHLRSILTTKSIGHSLGGGTAALVTFILREQKELSKVTCYTFASESGNDFITSIINGADIVPTFSAASVDDLRAEVTASAWINDLRNQIECTSTLSTVYRSASALCSRLPSKLPISYTMISCNNGTRILRTASLLCCPRVPTKPSPSQATPRMQSSSFSVSDQPDRSRGKGRGFDGRIEREGTAGRRGRGGSGADKMDALGRLLTRILRHMASELNLEMRSDGYVKVQDLLKLNLKTFANIQLKAHSVDEIKEAVRKDNKQRFNLLVENGKLLIRANQGHTLKTVESDRLLKPIISADEIPVCVHGTYKKNMQSILDSGLKRMQRLHMHFSPGLPTDGEVISGMRQNVNVLIFLDVRKALEDGIKLYISDNRVILTEGFDGVVPVKYFDKILSWPDGQPIPFLKSVQ